jgi:aldehyde dehydrogenase (NAD+)
MADVVAAAKQAAVAAKVGDPLAEDTSVDPLASKAQFEKVQRLISQGIAEGQC